MENYKIAAINNYFKQKNLKYSMDHNPTDISYRILLVNNTPIYARIANTPDLLARGLMHVEKLGQNEGCLLDFGQEVPVSLWMKNCKINMQTAMINKQGTIISIQNMYYTDPYRAHNSPHSIRYALEMSENFFDKANINIGDNIRLL